MTTIIGLTTAAAVLLTSAASLLQAARNGRQVGRQIAEVHVLVNSRLTDVIDRNAQLLAALQDKGVVVPAAAAGSTIGTGGPDGPA
jgi:hypothetical protein